MIDITRTYTYIGIVSSKNGNKVSFRMEPMRKIKTFAMSNLRADFVSLPQPMTKIDALNWAIKTNQFSNTLDVAILYDCLSYQTRTIEKVTGPKRPRGRPRKIVSTVTKDLTAVDMLDIYNSVKKEEVAQ